MKPLPSHISDVLKATDSEMPALATAAAPYSSSNRRTSTSHAYPWLLFTSTSVAALFCFMYITKPVIQTVHSTPENPVVSKPIPPATDSVLPPVQNRLPDVKPSGKASSRDAGVSAGATPSTFTAFEQTNLRIQHILTAETPGGHLAKIDLDVPVLYQSRNLRWTPTEVAEARGLLTRLTDYQEKSRMLRAEGAELLDSWNRLIEHSIPTGILRADSPTLPTNQQDAADTPRPAGLNTNELIKIQPADK